MQAPQDAILLRAFIGEALWSEGRALYRVVVEAARAAGLAGAGRLSLIAGPILFS